MTVVHVAYDVPEDMFAKLSTGELSRFGSVVRDSTRIVAHLKEATGASSDQVRDVVKCAGVLNDPRVLAGLGLVVVVPVAAVFIWSVAKKKSAARRGQSVRSSHDEADTTPSIPQRWLDGGLPRSA